MVKIISEKLFKRIKKKYNKKTSAFDIMGKILDDYVEEMDNNIDYLEARLEILNILLNYNTYEDYQSKGDI